MNDNRGRSRLICFLLALSLLPWLASGQAPRPVKSSARDKPSKPVLGPIRDPEPVMLPQTVRLGNADVLLTDVVPNTEAALARVREIVEKTKDPAQQKFSQELDALSGEIERSRDETRYVVRNVRSTEQLNETSIQWFRDQQQLQALNSGVRARVQMLTEQQRKLREIGQAWVLADEAAAENTLPPDLLDRIHQVQTAAANADAALRSALDALVELQVRISDTRKNVEDVLQQIHTAQQSLQASIFVLDSPPLWSAVGGGSYASLREQARITAIAVRSRLRTFAITQRNVLLAYFILLLALMAAFFRLERSKEWQAIQDTHASARIVQRPFSLAAFTLLFLFVLFFPYAPPEVIRLTRFLLIFPMLRIALAIFEPQLRLPLVLFTVFYALDVMTGHMAAGTLLRRLLVFTLTVASLAAVAFVRWRRTSVATLVAQRGSALAALFIRFAVACVAGSAMANLVGCVALADLLMRGTFRAIYNGIALYVMYLVFDGLVGLFTLTRVGQASRMVRLHRQLVLARVDRVLRLIGWLIWAYGLLVSYQVLRETVAGFRTVFSHKWTIGAVSISIGDVSLFFLVLLVGVWVAKAIRFFLEEELFPRTHVSTGAAQSSSRLVHYALVSLGFFLALGAAGLDLGRVTLLTGAFGVGMGFGLQNIVNNFVSGIIISLERPMQVGDEIEIAGLHGKVTGIGFRSSTIRTADGAEVILPNSDLVSKSLINWSLTDRLRRRELRVGVVYGTDTVRVLQILARIVRAHPDVLKNPEPEINLEEFGEGALEFSVRFWSTLDKVDSVRSDLNQRIAEELGANGMLAPLRNPELYVGKAAVTRR
jgi:potassium-dependent mechanosensitive channel